MSVCRAGPGFAAMANSGKRLQPGAAAGRCAEGGFGPSPPIWYEALPSSSPPAEAVGGRRCAQGAAQEGGNQARQRPDCREPFSHQFPCRGPTCHQPETSSRSDNSSSSWNVLPCQCSTSAPQVPAIDSPLAVCAVQWPSHPWRFFSARQVPWITSRPPLASVHVPSAASGRPGKAPPVQLPCKVCPRPAVAIQVPWKVWAGSCATALRKKRRSAISRPAMENDARMRHLQRDSRWQNPWPQT